VANIYFYDLELYESLVVDLNGIQSTYTQFFVFGGKLGDK